VFGRSASLALLGAICALAQSQFPIGSVRPLVVNKTDYHLRAGHSVKIDAPPETLSFVRNAKIRTVVIDGTQRKGLVLGPNARGDQVLLAASLTMKPGDYTVTLSAANETGEERAATINVTVDALTPVSLNAPGPPVVLLDGWQFSLTSSCPKSIDSSDNFGNLETYLNQIEGLPVYFCFPSRICG
jgi:hypothetical protein